MKRVKSDDWDEEERNFDVLRLRANNEEALKKTLKLFKEELLELIDTYINPWIK